MKIQIRKIQIARRIVQISVVLLMLAIPLSARYGNYLAARELDKYLESWEGSLQGQSLQAVDQFFRALPNGEEERVGSMVRNREQAMAYAQNLRGGPWSAQLGPLSLTDPLAIAESLVSHRMWVPALFIGALIPVIVTLLLGRVFCSWICPMNLLLEITDRLRGFLEFLEIKPRNVHFSPAVKYVLLGVGLAVAALVGAPILGYIYPPAIISREAHDFVFGIFDRAEIGKTGFWMGGLTWMSLIILGIALFEVIVSKRWWCRYVCPGGALYSMIGAVRPVRVQLTEPNCTHCGDCVVVCPMGLNPMNAKMGPECDNCGLCISHCGDDALHYRLTMKSKKAA